MPHTVTSPATHGAKMQLGLVIINGPRRGEILSVEPGQRVRIGRDDDCAMQLPDAAVSRHHCEVWLDHDGMLVQDLGSSLGTLVNTELIDAPTQLTYNYDLQIGSTVLRVVNPTSMPTMLPKPDERDPLETLFETRIARDRQLGDVLVEQGATSHNHISQAIQKMTLQFRQKHKLPPDLGTVLVYHKVVSDEQLKEGLLELNRRRADARAATARTAGMNEAQQQFQQQVDMAAYGSPESDQPLQKLTGDEGRFDYGGMSTGELVGGQSEDSMIEPSYATSSYSDNDQPPTYEAEMPGGSWDDSPAAEAWGASEPEIHDHGTGSADWGVEGEAPAAPVGARVAPPQTQDMTRMPKRTQRVSAHDEMPVTLRDGELNSEEVDANLRHGVAVSDRDGGRPSRQDRATQGKGKGKGKDKQRDPNEPTERPRKYAHPINYLAALLMAVAMLVPMARMGTTELQSWSETLSSTEGEPADVLKPTLVYYTPTPTDAPADPLTNWLWMAAAGMVLLTLLGETFGFMRMRLMSLLYGLGAFAAVAWVLTMGFSETGLTMWQSVDTNTLYDVFSMWGLGMWALLGAGVVWLIGTLIRPKKALLSWIFAFLLAVGVIGWMVVTVLPGATDGSFMVLPIGGAS